MIKGSTISLNETELRVAGLVVKSFYRNYNRKDRKITAGQIIYKLSERDISIGDAALRKVFSYIRRNNLMKPGFILSDNEGYWYSEDRAEMETVWKSQYGRAIEIMTNFKPLHLLFSNNNNQKEFDFEV